MGWLHRLTHKPTGASPCAPTERKDPEKGLEQLCTLGQALRELAVSTRQACVATQRMAMTESRLASRHISQIEF